MLSPFVSAGQGNYQDPESGLSKADSYCPGMAQHALVLQILVDSSLSTPGRESVDAAIHAVSTQGSPRS